MKEAGQNFEVVSEIKILEHEETFQDTPEDSEISGDNNRRGVGFEEKLDPKSPPPDSDPSLERTSELLKNRQDEEKARANKIKAVEDAAAANMSGNGLLGNSDQKTTK